MLNARNKDRGAPFRDLSKDGNKQEHYSLAGYACQATKPSIMDRVVKGEDVHQRSDEPTQWKSCGIPVGEEAEQLPGVEVTSPKILCIGDNPFHSEFCFFHSTSISSKRRQFVRSSRPQEPEAAKKLAEVDFSCSRNHLPSRRKITSADPMKFLDMARMALNRGTPTSVNLH
jgi:hypothetical protein